MTEQLHPSGDIVAERYKILDPLGEGSSGVTYKAQDLQTDRSVALKVLSLRHLKDWKILELFEREARVLSQLEHPAIPQYLNSFQTDGTEERRFYLVQQLASGQSLAELIESGWRAAEEEVREIAAQVLEILIYLHGFSPPVIHRDLKPQNILCDGDGRIALVDFGTVTDSYRQTLIGSSTIVGTYGYMAPEQFRGQASPATDLYGLGATILFLLSHRSPVDFPERQLKIDFRSEVEISKPFANWLERMLEPVAEDRFESAAQALAVLKGEQEIPASPRQPAHSHVVLTKTRERIAIAIPHRRKGLIYDSSSLFSGIALFVVATCVMLAPTASTDTLSGSANFAIRTFCAVPLSGIGLYYLGQYLFSIFGLTKLEIDRHNFCLQWCLFVLKRRVLGKTDDIDQVKSDCTLTVGDEMSLSASTMSKCKIVEGTRQHYFGGYLTEVEQEWLIDEISTFLRKLER